MNKRAIMMAMTRLFAAAMLTLFGAAPAAAMTVGGAMDGGDVDIWQFECTSSLTHCMHVSVCDQYWGSPDTWEVTIGVYSPTTLLGRGSSASNTYGGGGPYACTPTASVCREPATNHGPMKALVNVNHPFFGGDGFYDLAASCTDVNGYGLPGTSTKLTVKTNQ